MNKNVEATCGKIQAKGQPGLRGMAIGEIEKMIEGLVASNANLSSEFTRLKKGKVPKGESKRLRYCAFLKQKLGSEWAKYSKGKEAAKPAEAAPVPKEVRRLLAAVEGEDFRFNSNNEGEMANIENNNGQEGGNYANENNQPMKFTGFYERARRTVNKDPLKGAKLSRARIRQIKKQLRNMRAAGVNLPNFPNMNAMIKFAMIRKPTAPIPTVAAPNSNSENANAPVFRRKLPVKRMKLTAGGTARTARVPAGRKVPAASSSTRLSKEEIRAADALANMTTKAVMLSGGNRVFLKEILSTRYTNADANSILKRITNLDKMNYNSTRGIIRQFELNRARALSNIGAPIAASQPVEMSGIPGSMISSLMIPAPSGNRPLSMAEIMRNIRKKKVDERTPTEKRLLKAAQAMAAIRRRRLAGKQRAATPVVTTKPINLNSNKNSSNQSNSNVGSPVIRSPPGSNSNSNSNSPPVPQKVVEALVAQRKETAKAENRPAVRPIPRSLTGIRVNNGVTKFRGQNVNAMNKSRLVNVAKRMYAYLKPKEVIPFENANVEQVRKLVKSAAKKILAVK